MAVQTRKIALQLQRIKTKKRKKISLQVRGLRQGVNDKEPKRQRNARRHDRGTAILQGRGTGQGTKKSKTLRIFLRDEEKGNGSELKGGGAESGLPSRQSLKQKRKTQDKVAPISSKPRKRRKREESAIFEGTKVSLGTGFSQNPSVTGARRKSEQVHTRERWKEVTEAPKRQLP